MKRAPLYILLIVVAVIVAILVYFLYLNITGSSDEVSGSGIFCSVAFLATAFVAIELLFRPYLFLRPRSEEDEEQMEEGEN
jgi:hypothetical protein